MSTHTSPSLSACCHHQPLSSSLNVRYLSHTHMSNPTSLISQTVALSAGADCAPIFLPSFLNTCSDILATVTFDW